MAYAPSTNGHYDADRAEWLESLTAYDLPADRRRLTGPDALADALEAALAGRLGDADLGTLHAAAKANGERLRAAEFRAALLAATSADEVDTVLAGRADGNPLNVISSADLDAGRYERRWLVDWLLAEREPLVIGGPRKALKTTIMIDLAISIATGTDFLGKWRVPDPLPVGIVSAESGAATIQETARRIAAAKSWRLGAIDNLHWSFAAPQLSNPTDMAHLRTFIRRHDLRALFLDPLYLLLGGDVDAGNVFDMGPRFRAIGALGDETGCLIGVAHHTVKRRADPFAPLELEDLQWSGAAEFARQWLLISRREPFDGERPGNHKLQLAFGGSAGHAGHVAIDVDEGSIEAGRKWAVIVRKASEVEGERTDAKTAKRAADQAAVFRERHKDTLKALRSKPEGATKRDLQDCTRLNSNHLGQVLAALLEEGLVEVCDVTKANRKKPYEGFRLKPESTSEPNELPLAG